MDITLVAYDGRTRGFFNRVRPGGNAHAATLKETVLYFRRLAWIR